MLPKKAGDEIAGELLARGYHRMLGHLTDYQMNNLTEMVLARCKWFPTVAECNEIMGEQSYSNPFYVARRSSDLDRLGYTPELTGARWPQLAAQADRSPEGQDGSAGLIGGESPVPAGDAPEHPAKGDTHDRDA